MHDPEIWTSWYVWLLAIPAVVIGTMIGDWIEHRRTVRVRHSTRTRRDITPARRPRL
ncbi:MAG: hypothetical protein KF814_06920 [Nitrospiraceae bacterium]|nr:hypothetical protein [Nitrospiraceae bacterium]